MHPVSIDDDLSRLHRDARFNAEKSKHARDTLSFYRQHREIEPFTPLLTLSRTASECSRQEGECLRLINARLFDAGLEAGQTVEIDEHLYRIFSYGSTAICLGQIPPRDEIPFESLLEALDDAHDCPSEHAEWNSDYLRSIAIS